MPVEDQKNNKDQVEKFIHDLNQWVLNIMSGDLSSRIEQSDYKDLKVLLGGVGASERISSAIVSDLINS